MDFGSKYVYKYEHSSEESLSDSDEESSRDRRAHESLLRVTVRDEGATGGAIAPVPAGASAAPIAKRKKRLRKADTNVLSVKFNRLLQPGEMHAGDPVYCSSCSAAASHLSKIQPGMNDGESQQDTPASKWQCEFCPAQNSVDIEQADLPKQEDATYLVSPAPLVVGSDMSGVDDSIVIFLIDISGSMSATTLVQGTFEMPNATRLQERTAAQFDGERPIRQRNQTYVSRLQGVQMAVDANLDKLVKDTPTRRAALLTFNHEITYYGDGTREEPLVIRGDKLNNAEELLREAEREQNKELKPISETRARLTEQVYDLEEGGQTALGPAVLLALNIASKRRGSKIVICTDGLANRGLGNLEMAQEEQVEEAVKMQALDEGNQFYAGLTESAREKGISMSVITIKGTNCLLSVIGQMADGTSGNVTIVDLMNIRDEFASILEQKVIATNVEATLIVHRGLYIRDPDNPDEKLEKVKRSIGNVTKQTEVTFEFGIRNKQELKDKYQIDLDQLKQLPFQVQVTYTASDGSKALRVLTQLKETTANREVAEINAFRGVLAENHIRGTAMNMMLDDDDDDDEEGASSGKVYGKWATPAKQKQSLAYMSKITRQKKQTRSETSDRFSETYWNKTSGELKSQVDSSKHRKMEMRRLPIATASATLPPPPPGAAPSLFQRFSGIFTGSAGATSEAQPPSGSAASTSSKKQAKKSYGFASSKLAFFPDRQSEDMYQYKNFSSEQMRSESPTRDEVPEATTTLSLIQDMDEGIETEDQKDTKQPSPPKSDDASKKPTD